MTSKAIETRRLYCFEAAFTPQLPYYARRTRGLKFLRELGAAVWAKHGRKGLPVPDIQRGADLDYSYAYGYHLIELAPSHHTVHTLLHELAHCMGFGNPHGKGFARKLAKLLSEYGRCEEGPLLLGMALTKVL